MLWLFPELGTIYYRKNKMAKPLTRSKLIKLIEQEITNRRLGSGTVTKGNLARAEREKSKEIAKGDTLGDVTGKERAILRDVEEILTFIAEKDDLNSYRPTLEALLKRIMKKAQELEAKEKEAKEKEDQENT